MASNADIVIDANQEVRRTTDIELEQVRNALREEFVDHGKITIEEDTHDNFEKDKRRQSEEEKDVKELTGMKGSERSSIKTQEIIKDLVEDN